MKSRYIRLKTPLLLLLFVSVFSHKVQAQQTITQYLSGTDKDHTVNWDFMVTRGRNSAKWSTIPVPSCWEMQGFGTYNYYQDVIRNEQGLYKHKFTVAPQYKGKKILIVFEAAMTETEVMINGQLAGPIHQGGFYEFTYDISNLIKFGQENLLEVTVSKESTNASINRAERKADFWLFGGIFRPVYLQILPPVNIERVAINATATGDFNMQVFTDAKGSETIEAQVYELNGKPVDRPFTLTPGDSMIRHHFTNPRLWNPEQPNLYNVVVSIKEGDKTIHSIKQRFGFRTAELREQDGFYVNGKKVIFKGVCRHSEWPESGRTLSPSVHLADIAAIKGMNMNAVRMSHYPPDRLFLDLCDSLGLFVLDELTGWQAAYDTAVGRKLVKELVVRDVNHPSIVLWDNGNEGGWNRALDGDYDWYDPQKRHVIHPWERFNGTNTKHYPDFKYIQNEVANAKEVFFPTEFMHGLFDGGHGAALEDFWNEMLKHPHLGGGFLWSLHDEGIVRADRDDSIDVAGNAAPDGIVGPHREREASYYTIKELWSPVYIDAKANEGKFTGKVEVENRYIYTDLKECRFEWKLVRFAKPAEKGPNLQVMLKGVLPTLSLAPGQKGLLHIPLPQTTKADAVYLSAISKKGDTICTWSWPVSMPLQVVKAAVNVKKLAAVTTKDNGDVVMISCDNIAYHFNKTTGFLQKVVSGKNEIHISGGPALAGSAETFSQFKTSKQGQDVIVQASYNNDSLQVSWTFSTGKLPRLDYTYAVRDTADFSGITFNYPEENIKGMKWAGRGPFRVWKNRLKGQQLGVWEKAYNNTVTGENWKYPEFKGWHSQLYWVTVQNTESNFTVYTDQQDIYLQMLQPQKPKAANNTNTSPPFPAGSIGFMHAISPIGTKFQKADVMGPQSQRNVRTNATPLKGTLYFDFR